METNNQPPPDQSPDNLAQKIKIELTEVRALPWQKYLLYILLGVGGLAITIFIYNRFSSGVKSTNTAAQVAPEAPKAETVAKQTIPGPKSIIVYQREDLLKKIPIPAEVSNNKQNQFTATADVKPSPYGVTAVSFTNMSTGQTQIAYQSKPRPLFGLGGKTSVGALGGMSTKGNIALGYVAQDILRVGPINIGIAAGGGVIGTDAQLGSVIHVHAEF